MAQTNLSNVFQRELWTYEDILQSAELLNLFGSKIVGTDAAISAKVNAEDSGTTILVPFESARSNGFRNKTSTSIRLKNESRENKNISLL